MYMKIIIYICIYMKHANALCASVEIIVASCVQLMHMIAWFTLYENPCDAYQSISGSKFWRASFTF